jgi:16S rRNA (adenine1518-N6/adenine1519-N6)-dimethyltransferase
MKSPHQLLRQYNLTPRKSLGQNFLVDASASRRIAQLPDLKMDDTVVEIGAGLGTLTYELSILCERVIAVETDPSLVAVLHQEFEELSNIYVYEGDILQLQPTKLLAVDTPQPEVPFWGSLMQNYVIVANLPYYITAAVIRHMLESAIRPRCMVVTVQREVAERMVAAPGNMSLLSVSTQFYGTPRIVMRLKRGAFYPAPKVDSAVIRLDLYQDPPVPVDDIKMFFAVVRAGFALKRKQLRNSLAAGLKVDPLVVEKSLSDCGIDYRRRAETLSIDEWSDVYRGLYHHISQSQGNKQ